MEDLTQISKIPQELKHLVRIVKMYPRAEDEDFMGSVIATEDEQRIKKYFPTIKDFWKAALQQHKTPGKNPMAERIINSPRIPLKLEPLAEKARKYKTAKEFIRALGTPYGEIGDRSRTPVDIINMVRLGELDPISNYDIETQKDWLGRYTEYETPIPKTGKLTIYRATEGDKIRPGDYVTQSKEYAKLHLDAVLRGEGKVIELKNVELDELVVVNHNEFWYATKEIQQIKDLKSFWNLAQKKHLTKEERIKR